jgi:scyllo-inositol 2-dehydrogenase (NAD+)
MSDNKSVPTSVAVFGCGAHGAFTSEETLANMPPGWAPLNYAEAAHRTPGIKLAALCDHNEAHLEEAAKLHGVDNCFTDHRTLLDQGKPDIAIVSTRMPGRGGIIRDCIDAGVGGILFENPLATSMAEAETILSALRGSQTPFSFGALRRFSETYRRARNMIEIGELRHITVEHGYDMLMW